MELDTNQSQGSEPEQATNGTEPVATTPVKPQEEDPAARFRGSGTSFKAKLIGIDDVPESRGDKMCQDSILKLKAAVLASGQHKQKIIVNVSLKGLRIINLTNGDVEHEHAVHRISFIARDLTDRRAFGYIYGAGEGKHSFFAIKTAKIAEHLVLALRDLFQVVYDMKKKEMEEAKQQAEVPNEEETYAVPNNRPAPQAQQQESNLLAMEQQLQNMQGLNELDAFNPWPEDAPTSPETPGSPTSSDMFGIANLSDISSLSSDFSLASSSGTFDKLDTRTSPGDFRRTNSGKSVVSWHGRSTSHPWPAFRSDRKKRNIAKGTENGVAAKPPFGKIPRTNSNKSNKSQEKPAIVTKQKSIEHVSPDKTNSPVLATHSVEPATKPVDNSFFEEVMMATGIASQSPADDEHTDNATNNGSLSSLSSTNSKASTPRKSLSISNLFSSKSDKSKSRNKNKQMQSSVSTSVLPNSSLRSPMQKASSTDHVSSPTGSARLQRTSSSSSTTSSDRLPSNKLSRGYSSASNCSTADLSSSRGELRANSSERIPPPASIARSRPRAQSSLSMRATHKDSKNPPMFKKMRSEASLEERRHGSTTSLDSVHSTTSLTTTEAPAKPPSSAWACFDDVPSSQFAQTKQSEPSRLPSTLVEANEEAWPTPTSNNETSPASSNLFSDAFMPTASISPTTVNKDTSVSPNKSQMTPETSDIIPPTVFDNCDPFGEMTVEDPLDDPFADVSKVFGNLLQDKTPSPVKDEDPFKWNEDSIDGPSTLNKEVPIVSDKKEENLQTDSHQQWAFTSPQEIVDSVPTSSFEDLSEDFRLPPLDEAPPPLPPRIPKRRSIPNEEESLPPSIPPPPLPVITTEEEEEAMKEDLPEQHKEDQDEDVSDEIYYQPPSCDPPELPPLDGAIVPPIPTRNPGLLPWEPFQEQKETVEDEISPSRSDESPFQNFASFENADSSFEVPRSKSAVSSSGSLGFDFFDSLPGNHPTKHREPPTSGTDESSFATAPENADLSSQSDPAGKNTRNPERNFPKLKPPPQNANRNKKRKQFCPFSLLKNEQDNDSSSSVAFSYASTLSDLDGYLAGNSSSTSEGMTQSSRNKSYSDDLAGFDLPAVQPAAAPGAKLTKDQILAGFPVAAPPQMPAYQQQMAGMQIGGMPQMGGQMGGYQQGFQPQGVPAMGAQPGYANPNPFGQGFQAPAAQPAYGAFPSGPSPAVPARPGAMQPPVAVVAQTGAPQNPFGDALAPTAQLMAPVSTNPSQNGSDGAEDKKASDPFASLIPGMGTAPAGNKKDMFKNFQMAKPPQPPPRSAENVSANFESYMRKSVGGVPLDDANNNLDAPVPAPRSSGQDALGAAVNGAADASSDPFAMFNSAPAEPFNFANQPQQQNASLFG